MVLSISRLPAQQRCTPLPGLGWASTETPPPPTCRWALTALTSLIRNHSPTHLSSQWLQVRDSS